MTVNNVFDLAMQVLRSASCDEKCTLALKLWQRWQSEELAITCQDKPLRIQQPGRPQTPELVSPKKLKKRSLYLEEGRRVFMHAVAHIEFNAIDLACDAVYRYRHMPAEYYADWIKVAADESRHFQLVNEYLRQHDCAYGNYPAHNGLWDMAVKTADNHLARLAIVPRVLEARGLDVTPNMIVELEKVGDRKAVEVLQIIYQDEISHVAAGSRWFRYVCEQQGCEPDQCFVDLVKQYIGAVPHGPFNLLARRKAGFNELELALLQKGNYNKIQN